MGFETRGGDYFWTAATYFVTEDSTPTVVRLGWRWGDFGIRQKSAMQWRVVRTAAMSEVTIGGVDRHCCQNTKVFQRIAKSPQHSSRFRSMMLNHDSIIFQTK